MADTPGDSPSPQKEETPPDSMSGDDLPYGPLHYRIDKREIVFLADLLESYEHLGMVRTVDPVAAIVEILYAPDFYDDVVALMESLEKREVPSLARMTIKADNYP